MNSTTTTRNLNDSDSSLTKANRLNNNANAIFRNPADLSENPIDIDIDIGPNLYDLGDEADPDSSHDILEPLLPPHINYDKVNKYGQVPNDTFFFQTFYFHPSFGNFVLLSMLVLFTLWVIVMNLLTIVGLWRTHRKGHMADVYLCNLAVGDTLLGVLILPPMSVVILLGYFPFDRFVCDLWVFLDYYLIVASSFGSCALMCNYLWMIKWPSTFPLDIKHHILAIALCWIAVNLSWTPPFFNDRLSTYYPDGQCGFSISRNQYFSFYIGISGFYIPLAVALICGIWSLAGLKTASGIPLLSLRQSLSIGRRNRSSRLIDSLDLGDDYFVEHGHPRSRRSKRVSYAPDGRNVEKNGHGHGYGYGKNRPRPYLKHLKHEKQSITAATDPKVIAQVAKDHYPLVVSSLILFIICRSLFYVYFGVGSFVHNFFPLDLSNGVYWLMHSNAAISPLIHFAFDPELRQEVSKILGIRRDPQKSPIVEPQSIITAKRPLGEISSSVSTSNIEDGGSLPTISIGADTDRRQSVRTLEHFMYPNAPMHIPPRLQLQQQVADIRRSPPENANGIRL